MRWASCRHCRKPAGWRILLHNQTVFFLSSTRMRRFVFAYPLYAEYLCAVGGPGYLQEGGCTSRRIEAASEHLSSLDSARTVAIIRAVVLLRGSSVLVVSASLPVPPSQCARTARLFSTASVAPADVRLVPPFSVVEGVHVCFSDRSYLPVRASLKGRRRAVWGHGRPYIRPHSSMCVQHGLPNGVGLVVRGARGASSFRPSSAVGAHDTPRSLQSLRTTVNTSASRVLRTARSVQQHLSH